MKNFDYKKLVPHVIAILVFLSISVIYCKPALEGKVLNQHDTQGWKGMAQQSLDVMEKTGHMPLWSNSMFSGMPAYQIAMDSETKIGVVYNTINKILSLGLPSPINYFFLASLFFYFLCIVSKINPWVAILGGIAYAYATYNPIIIGVGHNTKMLTIAYAPAVFAGMLLLFQRKYMLGFVTTTFFAASFIGQNHIQIVYYILLCVAIMSVAFIISSIKENETIHAFKASFLGLIAGLIGLGTMAVVLIPTFEYSKETMRGGISKLTLGSDSAIKNKTKNGLDKDYALRWSMGKMETFTFMVPGLYGGSNGGNEHSSSANMVQKMTEIGVPEESALGAVNGYSYWGSMSSLNETTSGPAYLGAIICFLFIFGLVYIKGWQKWWLLCATIFGMMLGWGNNFMAFNSFMLDYFPYLSKFRAPSMAMVIPQLCIPFLAVIALNQFLFNETDKDVAWKKLKICFFITGGILILLTIFYFTSNYTGKGDQQIVESLKQNFAPQNATPEVLNQAEVQAKTLVKALREDRQSETGGDLLRTIILISLAAGGLILFSMKKISALAVTISIIILTSIDLLSIDNKYLNQSKYKENEEVEGEFTPTAVDVELKKDPDHANFRVFNTTTNYTNESLTSYHHNSIGGYHPAKLGLYQDLIEHQISKGNMQVLSMLNAKYFIVANAKGQQAVQLNPNAFGNCWLVKGIKFVSTANDEMTALDSTNLKDTAVVNIEFKNQISQLPLKDTSAYIKVKLRENDKIDYDYSSSTPQFAVFSEVYYSKGWDAYLDNKKVDYAKVNYALRGMYIPAGKHNIIFKFEPTSFYLGRYITIASYSILYLLLIVSILKYFKKKIINP